MTAIFKILITGLVFLLSLPVLAGDSTAVANELTKIIKEYEDIIKHFITLLGVFITVWGAITVAKITRKAPDAATKLEQIKFIDSLIVDKAWQEEHGRFVVEEAFQLYYNKYIPVDIIVLLAGLEARFYAFSSYIKVSGLTSFNKDSHKIKSLTLFGKWLRAISILLLIIILLHIVAVTGIVSYSLLMSESDNTLTLIFGGSLAFSSAIAAYGAFVLFDLMIDIPADFNRFEKDLEGYIEKTEIRNADFIIILVSLIIIVVIWFVKHLYFPM